MRFMFLPGAATVHLHQDFLPLNNVSLAPETGLHGGMTNPTLGEGPKPIAEMTVYSSNLGWGHHRS